jgi:tetratricopeptide (TPR) repeat protein
MQTGEYAQATIYLQQALDIARQTGNRSTEAYQLTLLGILHQRLGEYEEAISCFLRSLTIEEELGHRDGVAGNLANLGWVSFGGGDYDSALDYYSRALEIFRTAGLKYGQASTLQGLGAVYSQAGEYTQALLSFRESLQLSIEIGNRDSESDALSGIGGVLFRMESYDEADEALQRSLAIREEIGNLGGVVDVLLQRTVLYRQREEHTQELEALSHALQIARTLDAQPVLASVHEAFSQHYETVGDAAMALEHYKEYHRIEAAFKRSEVSTQAQRFQAQLDLERLEKEAALARLKSERMEHELNVARRVQTSLLPMNPPRLARLDIAASCVPALEVGGDYFDFFPFNGHQIALAIGDITGKGIPAAIHPLRCQPPPVCPLQPWMVCQHDLCFDRHICDAPRLCLGRT